MKQIKRIKDDIKVQYLYDSYDKRLYTQNVCLGLTGVKFQGRQIM